MGSRRFILFVLAAAVLAVCVGAPAPSASPVLDAKKKCKWVTKKIHGKKRRVRVCHTVKPKPKPKPTAKPIDVGVTLDSAHAASFTATPSGGSVSTTSSTGAKVTLSVPAGATQRNVTIQVTPLQSVSNLPLKALAAGVQLQPDGLQLDKPATLTIQPASLPPGKLIGFSYSANGQDVHPYPMSRTGNVLSFTIGHFSGYGAGTEADAARAALVGTMVAEWASIVASFPRAAIDPSYLADSGILVRYWSWMTMALAYPELQPYIVQLRQQAQQAVRNAADLAERSCHGSGLNAPLHEFQPVFDVLRGYERARQYGVPDILDPVAELQLKGCLSFELDFDTVITWTVDGGQVTSHVRVQGLELNAANHWSNEKDLDYVSFTFPQSGGCAMTLNPHGEKPFKATMRWMDNVEVRLPDRERMAMDVQLGQAAETITISCPQVPSVRTTGHFYDGIFIFHGNSFSFPIEDWSYAGGGAPGEEAVLAKRDYSGTFAADDGTIAEDTHFVLRHTPH